jgi:excisionase family DNA binding protein
MIKSNLSIFEAAAYCKVHPNTIYRSLRSGELEGIKRRTGWLISKDAVVGYLMKREADVRTMRGAN